MEHKTFRELQSESIESKVARLRQECINACDTNDATYENRPQESFNLIGKIVTVHTVILGSN